MFSNINIVNGWELTKIVLMKQKFFKWNQINNNRVKKDKFFILHSKWNIYVIKHLNWEY